MKATLQALSGKTSSARILFGLRDVDKEFPGENGAIVALEKLSLEVHEGEFLVVLGPSGCGKTTLLNLLAGLETPTCGQLQFHQQPRQGVPRAIGYVFQEPTLLPWRTIRQNVELPLEIAGLAGTNRDAVKSALALVGLETFAEEYPSAVSVGMRQKAAIARALVQDPEVLLMDEPFSSLDMLSREQLNLQLQEIWMNSRRTVVFVTHSISEALLMADRICLLTPRPGRLSREFRVTLPRPRDHATLASPVFARLLAQIHQAFAALGAE